MSKVCYVIGAGDFLNNNINKEFDDYVICADGGYLNAKESKLKVDLILGDFDSLSIIPDDIAIIRVSSIKDETDTCLAIKEGIKRGYTKFVLLGCLGKRIEHSLANITLLQTFEKYDIRIKDDDLEMFILDQNNIYEIVEKHGYVSLFSITPTTTLSIKGLKYELENYKLTNKFPLGIDNEAIGGQATINVNKGKLLVITRFK